MAKRGQTSLQQKVVRFSAPLDDLQKQHEQDAQHDRLQHA
jgi:hypothetical protein